GLLRRNGGVRSFGTQHRCDRQRARHPDDDLPPRLRDPARFQSRRRVQDSLVDGAAPLRPTPRDERQSPVAPRDLDVRSSPRPAMAFAHFLTELTGITAGTLGDENALAALAIAAAGAIGLNAHGPPTVKSGPFGIAVGLLGHGGHIVLHAEPSN